MAQPKTTFQKELQATKHMESSTITAQKSSSALTPMKGADLLVRCLEREGVEYVFAYPGGASMEIHQALVRRTQIRTILPRHEQGCGFMAHGYARTTGKAGVCMSTSGPGATNLVTCIADAFMDSVPLIAITGQVTQNLIGKTAFQETDVFGMTLPIVKHSYLVLNAEDIPRIVKEAFHIARRAAPDRSSSTCPRTSSRRSSWWTGRTPRWRCRATTSPPTPATAS